VKSSTVQRRLVVAAGAIVVVALVTAVAVATPPSGTVGAFLVRGTSTETFAVAVPREVMEAKKTRVRVDGKLRTRVAHEKTKILQPIISCGAKTPCDAVVQTIDFAPGGSTGWHSHPGALVVVVKAGAVTRYEHDCAKTTYSAGQAFLERGSEHVILVRNEGADPAQVYVTYIVPAGTTNANLRIEQPHPLGAELNPSCPVG
jgi:quercetin dioxygenase-like cupin family protein